MKFPREISASDWLRPSVIALVLANLIPVFGVILLGWKVFPLMFLFWSENVIIGALNVLKMLVADPESPVTWIGKLFVIPFFCVHYGMFTFVHGALVILLFGGGIQRHAGFPDFNAFWTQMFWQTIRENRLGWAILGMAASRIISFGTNYVGTGEYKRADVQRLMIQPYGRVMIMHVAILCGGFLMLALHSPAIGLLLLVALKMTLDLRGHLAERRKFAGAPVGAPVE